MERVIAYIDGFNLYFGLRSKGWQQYLWLNLQSLVHKLLKQNQTLVCTKYFTARVTSPPDKHKRQTTFIEALETLSDFEIYYGKYQLNPVKCRNCGWQWQQPSEKKTDVNIAVEMLKDTYQDNFDVALLVSADSDLVPVIEAIREVFPEKRIIAAFPPGRSSKELANTANSCFTIGRARIAHSLFPEEVWKAEGSVLKCPPSWK